MNDLNRFLKVMTKMGYPNPNTESIARSMDYDLDDFIPNLVEEFGEAVFLRCIRGPGMSGPGEQAGLSLQGHVQPSVPYIDPT